ncbi:MAG: hypothetical protein ACXWWR_00275 [Candidatus Limnocylindrales bacterium]
MSIVDQLNDLWNQILGFLAPLVIPDWGSLVGLLPIFLLVGVLGPLLSLIALVWLIYFVRKPRARLTVLEGPRPAPLAESGRPIYPTGYPYCARDGLIYPSGASVCERCHDELVVTCPKCGISRQARLDTCANCGLILKIDKSAQVRTLVPTGPPPGGAAAA